MGRGTWYYSLGVSSIIDAFVRVDDRSYLLSGATNSSEANGIIQNPKLELESFCFTFDLVPLSCGKRLYCLVGRKSSVKRGGEWFILAIEEAYTIKYSIHPEADAT
ncbi:hypothetical protein Tco_0937153 [Tanacetum coccineum]|uniref:Uncharacterized protein n=1 Tax=Tanacetum coccineum TaxID=301880 RepID=A0ABQ5DG78_9ASTR